LRARIGEMASRLAALYVAGPARSGAEPPPG